MWNYTYTDELFHVGKGHLDGGHSGRYPWGSGKKNKDKEKPLTAKQRARAMDDETLSANVKRLNLENRYAKLSKDTSDEKPDSIETAKKMVDTTSDFVRSTKRQVDDDIRNAPKVVREDLSKMTDQELRDKINRAALEQQYTNYYGKKEISKGQKYVSQVLDAVGVTLGIGSSALAIALAIKELKG